MLRALGRFLGTGCPAIGVNYGRVGFLTAIPADDLEDGLQGIRRRLPDDRALDARGDGNGETRTAVNDVVVAGGTLGRMIELGYAIGGEELGSQPCDALICATPAGSTAYNLSNGGPVLVWGLDAMVLTFVAPHAIHIRPLVVPRGPDVVITNLTRGRDDRARRRSEGRRARERRRGDGARRRAAEPARDAARGDVLLAVRGDVRS